jgi:hypothetical protein
MWRFRVKMLRGAPLNKADASLKLSLERLKQAQPAYGIPVIPQDIGNEPPPVNELVDQPVSEAPPSVRRGSLFTPSSDVFDHATPGAEPLEESSNNPQSLTAAPLKSPPIPESSPTANPQPTSAPRTAPIDPSATPPGLAVPDLLIRDEEQRKPQGPSGSGIAPFRLAVVVAVTALFSALLTYALARRPPSEEPPPPQLQELAQSIANQKLDAGRGELERREALIARDEDRLLEGLEILVKSNKQLARHHERSLKRAQKLETSLGEFAKEAAAIANSEHSASMRDNASALEAKAEGYRTALGQIAEQLDTEREQALERAVRLRDQLDHRPLRGRKVRVIYDPLRAEDAARVVELLNNHEMEAQLFEAEVVETTALKGRLFYSKDEEEAAALQIVRLVENLEVVKAEKIGVASSYMSLWIVGEPF